MKRSNKYKQNSRDWYTWRGRGLGASDAPAIMNVSPWTSRFELWGHKTGVLEREEPNVYQLQAMERGKRLEPIARGLYAEVVGSIEADVNCEHEEFDYIRASLDGYIAEIDAIVEIKAPNKEDHAKALNGEVPTKYYPQLQHQLLASGAKCCHYVSFDGEKLAPAVVVFPDKEYMSTLQKELVYFWSLVQNKEAPEVTEKDMQKVVKSVVKLSEKLSRVTQVLDVMVSKKRAPKANKTSVVAAKVDADGLVEVQ